MGWATRSICLNLILIVKLESTNLLKLGTTSYFTNEQSDLPDFLLSQDCELEEGLIPPYNCPGIYQVGGLYDEENDVAKQFTSENLGFSLYRIKFH